MSAKNLDTHGRERNKVVTFRVSIEENAKINLMVKMSGLTKQDYIIQRLICDTSDEQQRSEYFGEVFIALKEQLNAVEAQLKRVSKIENLTPELVESLNYITFIMQEIKEDCK